MEIDAQNEISLEIKNEPKNKNEIPLSIDTQNNFLIESKPKVTSHLIGNIDTSPSSPEIKTPLIYEDHYSRNSIEKKDMLINNSDDLDDMEKNNVNKADPHLRKKGGCLGCSIY